MGESRIGDFPWGYSNILGEEYVYPYTGARAHPFQPSNFINVSAAATDVAQW